MKAYAWGPPRALHDVRTAQSMPPRVTAGPQEVYARLSQLAREQDRLVAEQDVWRRKLDRIAARLTEIETQIAQMRTRLPGTDQPPAAPARPRRPALREVEFPY